MADNQNKNLAIIVGTRPNFVKAAPFLIAAKKYNNISCTLIHTGQHFDENMSKIFFDEMQIPKPDINLDVRGEYHTEKIGKMFSRLQELFKKNNFDMTVVFGDVNSTVAGALASIKTGCPLIHVEAGLRSHDRRMPEEINRAIVDHLSDILFTTEPSANENLIKEEIDSKKIVYVGNIMIDSLELFKEKVDQSHILDQLGLQAQTYILITIHRGENTDSKERLVEILDILNGLQKKIKVVWPLHPGTKKKIEEFGLQKLLDELYIIDPVGYLDFIHLIKFSMGVVTDSGGIQEETTHLGVPCCTLRDNTERPITLYQGTNKLFPRYQDSVDDILEHIYNTNLCKEQISLWDGKTSERILYFLSNN